MTPAPPCVGKSTLFFATPGELRYPERSESYKEAIALCFNCPHRQECGEDAIRYNDRHTVRAGLRLWIPEERANLRRFQ